MAVKVGRLIPGVFVTTGNPDTVNDTPPSTTSVGGQYSPTGQLGAVLRTADGTREYIYVTFSATSTGKTPAANDVLYWLSSTSSQSWTVDNQSSANSGVNIRFAAGVLRNACTRGNRVWAIRKGLAIPVNSTSTGMVYGDFVIASTASGAATFIASTATNVNGPVYYLGVVSSTATSSVAITTDLDIE